MVKSLRPKTCVVRRYGGNATALNNGDEALLLHGVSLISLFYFGLHFKSIHSVSSHTFSQKNLTPRRQLLRSDKH